MPVGWGVDPTLSGSTVTSGTTSQDVRKVWGALYAPGIISGCTVKTNANMTYTVNGGVVAVKTATGEVVMCPVNTTTIPTAVAPASGTRTDIIWVRQRTPTNDNNSEVVVEVGTTLPARAQEIRRYNVPAGITATTSAVPTGGITFSIPYGANLGTLHHYRNTHNGAVANNYLREGVGTIFLPTDRLLRFRYIGCHSAQGAVRFDDSKYCEMRVVPSLDGNDFELWTTGGLHQAWQTVYFETTIPTTAGTHTVSYIRGREVGPGTILQWNGGMRRGADFYVEDAGPLP